MQKVIFSSDIHQTLAEAIAAVRHDRLFVLCDDVTAELCWPVVSDLLPRPSRVVEQERDLPVGVASGDPLNIADVGVIHAEDEIIMII